MKTFNAKIWLVVVALLLITVLAGIGRLVRAGTPPPPDYWLVMLDLDKEKRIIQYERFVSRSDCYKRGAKMNTFAAYFGGNTSFACPSTEALERAGIKLEDL